VNLPSKNFTKPESFPDSRPGLFEIFFAFLLVGATSFGGGTVAYQKILIVDKKHWLSADEFLITLAIAQTLPGLNAANIAVLCGDRLRRAPGALAATIGLLLPGCAFVLLVGLVYSTQGDKHFSNLLLAAVAAAATGLLSAITYRTGKKHFKNFKSLSVVVASFFLMSVLHLSLVVVLLIMSPIAIFMYRPRR
jgi:chromate transporter